MTSRIDLNTAIDRPGPYGQGQATPPIQGQYRGRTVTVQDTAALFADAAEELTFASGEKVETQLARRKISKGRSMDESALERAGFYLEQLPDLGDAQTLNRFTEHLKQQKGLTPGQALDLSKEFFKDISHRFAGLSFARDCLAPEDQALKPVLTRALDLLEKKHGQGIRAGLNITGVAADFSEKGLGKIHELRAFYRDTVLTGNSPAQLYQSVKEKIKEADFKTAVGFLITALGRDLQSMGPSVSHGELKKVMDDLYILASLKNTDKACRGLMKKMGSTLGIKGMGRRFASGLMSQLMALKGESWQSGDRFLTLAETMGIHDRTETEIGARIYFLREIREVVRQMPLKLFDTLESREKILAAMQEALDIAIDTEEEMLS